MIANIKDIVDKINSLNIIQTEYQDEFVFPEELQDFLINNCSVVKSGLHIDKHRHYETAITVYQYNEKYFGLQFVIDLYSEMSSIEGISHTIKAFSMKQVMKPTYLIDNR
jgi:hypothetical protein